LLPRQTVPTDASATPAGATDEGGSPAKKTEQDATADSSSDGESSGGAAFAAARVGISRAEEFPAEQSLRIATSTTQQSNDRTGAAACSALTVRCRIAALVAGLRRRLCRSARRLQRPRRNDRELVLQAVLRSRYVAGSLHWRRSCADGLAELLFSHFCLLVSSLAWAAQSQRVGRSDVGVRSF
jgi:hypothetical protein